MTEHREVEAKFEATDDALGVLLDLSSFGRFRVHAREGREQDDEYYDTSDALLRDAGASLRIRRGSSLPRMTFKGDRVVADDREHAVSRLEDEVELPPAAFPDLDFGRPLALDPEPRPLQRARLIAGEAPLLPTARLLTSRVVLDAADADGGEVEVAVDRCRAERLSDGRSVEFVEVEIELKRGGHLVLSHAVDDLASNVPGLIPSTRTKLERALE